MASYTPVANNPRLGNYHHSDDLSYTDQTLCQEQYPQSDRHSPFEQHTPGEIHNHLYKNPHVHTSGVPDAPRSSRNDTASILGRVVHMEGRLATISWSFLVATCPMLLINAALLLLVFKFRVNIYTKPHPQLGAPAEPDRSDSVYYINLSATFLIFVSSWASSIAPLCSGMLVTLASYPICKSYSTKMQSTEDEKLPTPYQFSLLIRFLNGGSFGALWSWIMYCFSWERRPCQSLPVKQIAGSTILAVMLSFLVLMADTWLHISTDSVNVVTWATMTLPSVGFGLAPHFTDLNCTGAFKARQCAMNWTNNAETLLDGGVSLGVLNNISSLARVSLFADDRGSFAYLAAPPSAKLSGVDYSASTYGLQTQCQAITANCSVEPGMTSLYAAFNCPYANFEYMRVFNFSYNENAGGRWTILAQTNYFTNSSMLELTTMGLASPGQESKPVSNPFYFNFGTSFPRVGDFLRGPIRDDPAILYYIGGTGAAFVAFQCNTTIYDVSYDSVNGSIVRFDTAISNTSVGQYFQAPMALSTTNIPLLQAAMEGAVANSSSGDELGQKFANTYSSITTALGAQVIQRNPAVLAQQRVTRLLTRLEVKPFYTLLAANMSYVVIGCILAVAAAVIVSNRAVNDLQNRLSIFELVADRFEGSRAKRGVKDIQNLFEESEETSATARVVVLASNEGGMELRLRRGAEISSGFSG